ncbi:MAG: hypothetical protein HOE92_02480 [Euryarchaeota archaeon]|jgi:flagellar protein FlaH|nr:hypothetical protein [Euryarchaeota archaeon]MBT3971066.1 hypothetical protein [Euryarchaeota archaeon]MBT4407181.1 hypothetical protein [Euryarchaeota archaeon]
MEEPIEDGFEFGLEQDSLADSMGLKLPNRSLMLVCGGIGSGKSLITQRLVFGLIENGAKVVVVTTELTTRGWIEQMHSIGYYCTESIKKGRLLVLSRFGTIAQPIEGIGLNEVLASEAMDDADIIIIDSASSLMPETDSNEERFKIIQSLRSFSSSGRSILLSLDSNEMDDGLFHNLRASAEVVLDMTNTLIGGELKRALQVTRFLRAAGPIQTNIGWRVEPSMGFIVDITAVS